MNELIERERELRKVLAEEVRRFNEWFSFLAQDEVVAGELKLIRAQLDQMNALLGIIDCRLTINIDKASSGLPLWGPEIGVAPVHTEPATADPEKGKVFQVS